MITRIIKRQILSILKYQGVTKAAIFGSFATGEHKRKSDIDLLVTFKRYPSLLDISSLKIKLEKKIGKKFDVITYDSIYPSLKKTILKEQKIIYEKRP